MSTNNVTIVVPVYADWTSLKDCINALEQTVDLSINRVMLVNDCGPEADSLEKNITARISKLDGFEYFRNPKNLGFVGTCNRAAYELDKTDNDILLLNSDTKPTTGWLEEMVEAMYSQKNIGVISPRSNNANNCTIPLASYINKKPLKPEESFKIFQNYKSKFPRVHIMPTANGFCLLTRRSLIKKYGLFDEAFGIGYGEEVDYCQRLGSHGWLSALANHSFVYHLEAKSFSLETKTKLLEERTLFIRQRWPNFKSAITKDIEDSLLNERKILGKDAGDEMPYDLSKPKATLKQIIRSNKHVHRLAAALKHRLN